MLVGDSALMWTLVMEGDFLEGQLGGAEFVLVYLFLIAFVDASNAVSSKSKVDPEVQLLLAVHVWALV